MVTMPNTDMHVPAEYIAVSKFLSKILRHEPLLVGVQLDKHGWVTIDVLLRAIERTARSPGASKRLRTLPTVTREVILAVVATSDKQRFTLSSDCKRIRAAQGHSVEVNLGYAEMEPPAVLYHGTAWSNWKRIAVEGLKAQTRHAVHLSTDVDMAKQVGARHGQPLVLVVDAARMHADGYAFSRSDNGVWLIEAVPVEFLAQLGQRGHGSKS